MTRALYYASTIRNVKDVLRFFIHPLLKGAALAYFRNPTTAEIFASTTSAVLYGGLTTDFCGQEAKTFDQNFREAVSAEMGIDPKKFKFSDYWDTNNVIVQRERDDWIKIQGFRYLTDAAFLIPAALGILARISPDWLKEFLPPLTLSDHAKRKEWEGQFERRQDGQEAKISRTSTLKFITSGFGYSDLVYAGKAAYWYGETFNMPKTTHYELVKLRELFESTGQKIGPNQILAVVQRARTDQGFPIYNRAELKLLDPLLNEMADHFNEKDHFGISALTYLVGFNKIKVHDQSGQLSAAAIEQSRAEIQKVATIGLDGIREENRQIRMAKLEQGLAHAPEKSFVEGVKRKALDVGFAAYVALRGGDKGRNKIEEHVSSRDPADFIFSGR